MKNEPENPNGTNEDPVETKFQPRLEIVGWDELPENQFELNNMFWNQHLLESILADVNLLRMLCRKWESYPHVMRQPEWRPDFLYDNPQWHGFSEKLEGYCKR